MAGSPGIVVRLHWSFIEGSVDDPEDVSDPRWKFDRGLYAYLPPVRAGIDYIGKCYGTTVRSRWRYDAKKAVWDCINQRTKSHRVIVAEIETDARLTRELLADIESLLIFRVHQIQPLCNVSNTSSRGRHQRPGMKLECRGVAWPLRQKVFRETEEGE